MKFQCRNFIQSGYMKAQIGHSEGGGVNSSTFGHFVQVSAYFVHFGGVMRLGQKKLA